MADRNLLFGILALQLNFVSPDQLIRAMNAWVLSKTTPIEEILVSHGDMDDEVKLLLTALVDKHLDLHQGTTEKSLAALSSVDELRDDLTRIGDDTLSQSVMHLRSSTENDDTKTRATVAYGVETKHGGRFKVLRPHAKGGLGRVSIARDEELNREVALKEMLGKYSGHQENRDRFLLEAEITGGLEHPGIVPVYGLGNYNDGSPFYVMRFIEGDNLKDSIKAFVKEKPSLSTSERNLELRKLLRRFIDVCDAVSYAHSRSILHRDLKPGNIMLGKYGETLVVDWGLAKSIGSKELKSVSDNKPLVPRSGSSAAATMAGTTIGTPAYMSPEQAEGKLDRLGPATDVYSLGATFYYLLTGKPAFSGRETEDVLNKVRLGEFPHPREVDDSVPRPLEAICLKAMRREPNDRYGSPDDLAEDIERWLADEPVGAYTEPMIDQVSRTVRHNRTAVVGVTAILLSAIIGLIAVNAVTRSKNKVLTRQKSELQRQTTELEDLASSLQVARDETEENFAISRTMAFSLIKKSEEELSKKKGMLGIRHWLTERALKSFIEFYAVRPNDFKLKLDLAQLYRYAANLNRLMGDRESAKPQYDTAIELLDQLLIEDASHELTRDRLAETLRDKATFVKEVGELELAKSLLDRAIVITDSLRDEFPDSTNYWRTESLNSLGMSDVQIELASDDALEHAINSARLLRLLIDEENPFSLDVPLLLFALANESRVLRGMDRLPEAYTIAEQAVALAKERGQGSNDPGLRHTLARSRLEMTEVLVLQKSDLTEIEEHINDAIELWDKLEKREPLYYKRYRALAYAARARAEMQNEQFDDARADLEISMEVMKTVMTEERANRESSYPEAYADVFLAVAQLELLEENREASIQLKQKAIEQLKAAVKLSPSNIRLKKKLDTFEDSTDVADQ